jgi:CRP/FNR family transcriptional regulator, cyclic AMP receptor protein
MWAHGFGNRHWIDAIAQSLAWRSAAISNALVGRKSCLADADTRVVPLYHHRAGRGTRPVLRLLSILYKEQQIMTDYDDDMIPGTKDWITFAAGRVIFREGEPGDVLYIVVDGQVDVLAEGKLIETIEGPGGIVGEMALIDSAPRSATAVARTECTLVALNQEGFRFHIQKTPDFAIEVMQIMSKRLRKLLHPVHES